MDSSKDGLRLTRVLILVLMAVTTLVGCGHVQVNLERTAPDLKATETAVARGAAATITAQAPSPTFTSVATATSVIPPTPTASPTPLPTPAEPPTSTSTAVPSPMLTPTATRTPTPTPLPSHDVTATAATPTPIPSVAPTSVPCRLSLVSPLDGASFGDDTRVVTLQWQSDRTLASNEYFFVNVTYPHDGQTWYDGTWEDPARQIPSGTRDTSWELEAYLCAEDLSDSGCFAWNVAVKRREGSEPALGDEVECLSPTRSFCWTGCERKSTSTPVPPTETPPPTVYPPLPTATTTATWTPTAVPTDTATVKP